MRRFVTFAITAAFLGIGAISCTKDAAADGGYETQNGKSLTFMFKGLGSVQTYAIATDPENAVKDFTVYMFEAADGAFIKSFTAGSADCRLAPVGLEYVLTLSDMAQYGPGGKNFYFVANKASAATALGTVGTTVTTEAAFLELLSDELALNDGKAVNITNIDGLLFTQRVLNVDPLSGPFTTEVRMYRRVARFDIVNEFDAADLVIGKIFVKDAKRQGTVWEMAQTTPAINVASHEEIAGPVSYETISGERIAQSVFYLNPTTVKADGTGTQIGVLASYKGANAQVYAVNVDADLDIVANYRYKLVCTQDMVDGTLVFDLIRFMDWDEGAEHDLTPDDTDTFILSDWAVTGAAGNWDESSLTYNFSDNLGGTLSFKAVSGRGTSVKIKTIEGDRADLTTDIKVEKQTVVSYGAFSVTENYTITVPASTTYNGYMTFGVEVYSAQNPDAPSSVITFVDDAITLDASIIPDDVFRQAVIEHLFEGRTIITRAEMEAQTTIAFEEWRTSGVYSLKGIEYFPGLTYLHYGYDGPYLLTSLDISQNPALITLNCRNNKLNSLDVSNNPALESLDCSNCQLKSLDVSQNPALTTLHCYSNELTSIDVSNNPALTELQCGENSLTTLDVSMNPVLDYLDFRNNQLTAINISHNPVLTTLYCLQNQLTTLDWSNNPMLTTLHCHGNELTSLDLTQNTVLRWLYCSDNHLTTLDASYLDYSDTYFLECGIQTDASSGAPIELALTLHVDQTPFWKYAASSWANNKRVTVTYIQ